MVYTVQFGVFVDSINQHGFGNTTVFLLVALAAERYVAVVHPLAIQKRRTNPFTWSVMCVLLTWTLAAVLALPDIFTHSMEDLVFTNDNAGALNSICHSCCRFNRQQVQRMTNSTHSNTLHVKRSSELQLNRNELQRQYFH